VTERALFGDRLRRARERKQLTLHQIADRTKIGSSILAALEDGSCARWPSGVYSRSYVRSYADAIGVDPGETLAEFVVLFPHLAWTDQDRAAAVTTASAVKWATAEPLRLVLEEGPTPLWRRLLADVAWWLHRLATGRTRVPAAVEEATNAEPVFGELQLDR
jgi:transcriptional regulator with XRE-family HTH domain